MAALDTHWHAGRLDPGEHERRTTLAKAARTRTELDALFADLPERVAPRPPAPGHEVVHGPSPAGSSPVPVPEPAVPVLGGMLGRHRDTVMALTPFIALALFFLTDAGSGSCAIPVMGILLSGRTTGRAAAAAAAAEPQAQARAPVRARGTHPRPAARRRPSTSRARSTCARPEKARCAATYCALPSLVSIRTGSTPSSRRSYGAARMSSSRTSRASSKQSDRQPARQRRGELVRPLVEVHGGVQAARLLQVRLCLTCGGEGVARPGRRREEAERVEVRAADECCSTTSSVPSGPRRSGQSACLTCSGSCR